MLEIIREISSHLDIDIKEAELIVEKAQKGGEINDACPPDVWLKKRFLPNLVFIEEEDYARMCIDALKILKKTAGTDYGSSRQRDMGQLWADMTRGYLGEFAFILFLKKNWGISAWLNHEIGNLQDFLPTDIHALQKNDEEKRKPSLKISIKTAKWNGLWFDIPGDQFAHSNVHILVKAGTGRDHLFAFFKHISIFKDKILKRAKDIGCLSHEEADDLFEKLPSFKPIAAYICGFVKKDAHYKFLDYQGKRGLKNFTLTAWKGPIRSDDLKQIQLKQKIKGSVKFESIGEFSHENGYLFNTGSLLWQEADWKEWIDRI
ncbi:MAG: hypothetical protein ACOY3I_06355 [Verrucomicrobiota bacterium]